MSWGLKKPKDPLYRNAIFLIIASGAGGLLGFVFWLIVAASYDSASVGLSASLLALAGFLGSVSSLGLGIGLIRFLPSASADSPHRISASLTLATLTALGIGLVFLGGLDFWAPAVAFVQKSWSYSIMFLFFIVGFALLPLVDSSFLAARKASYVFQRTFLYSGLRLPIPILGITFLGAFGIFFSVGVALLASLLFSFLLLLPRLYPGFLAPSSLKLSGIRHMLTYSMGNHTANLLAGLPTGILPLLILSEVSASSSAHFYIAWMITGFLFVVPGAAATSLFVEGSYPGSHFTRDVIRSLRFGLLLLIPGVLVLFFASPLLLGLFGREYSAEGLGLLRILALAAFFVAINSHFFSFLRVNMLVRELILLSSILGVGTVVASYLLLDRFGILGPGIAFFSMQAAISGYVLLRNVAASKTVARGLMKF